MKIAIGQLSHETNTFSNVITNVEKFKELDWDEGSEIIRKNLGVKNYLGGMIEKAQEKEIELVPIFSAGAHPSGIIPKETYSIIKQKFKDNLGNLELIELDAICLSLHGAGVVEGIDDLEGDFLAFIRNLVGNNFPVIATLDLHGNITNKMIEQADLLLGVNLYPHTDSFDRGEEAIEICIKIINGELTPKMHLEKLPMIIPTSTSNKSPVKEINEYCRALEKHSEIIDCTFYHGFPYTDVAFGGSSVICIANGNLELASIKAQEVAMKVWGMKDMFYPELISPENGISQALKSSQFPVVINETSDNPGAGTPSDGTHLLSAMLNAKIDRACFGVIYDPEVVDLAHREGVGSKIEVLLGGKTDILHGEPLTINAYVKTLTDGVHIQSSPMWQGRVNNLGKTALLQVGGIDVIVGCSRSQVFDEQPFLLHGIDVNSYKIIGLKSSQHFRASYESIASEIITVDSSGISTLNLKEFIYIKLERPIYPLDKNILSHNIANYKELALIKEP